MIVRGGNSGLPEAMAAGLGDAIRLNAEVASVAQRADGVEVA